MPRGARMSPIEPSRVETILSEIGRDSTRAQLAAAELLPLLYEELKTLAAHKMERERRGQTLQATALVHEAYVRLVGDHDPGWNGRAHFFGAAAEAMRRILVERARAKARLKRGADRERVELTEIAVLDETDGVDVLALDAALERLGRDHPRKARVVSLRHFAGLELAEIAAALEVSLGTVKNDWNYALAWLHRELAS
jgi:RNA polymerase sigma factor (TIGR02999 family)